MKAERLDEIRARFKVAMTSDEGYKLWLRKALGDHTGLLAEVERLTAERDEFRESRGLAIVKCDGLTEEVERLRERLEWIVANEDCYNRAVVKIARDTLEGKEIVK